jgi:predicted RNase H-like HicB family nuclease
MKHLKLTGVFWHEGKLVVSKCPEIGIASCGTTVEEALANLREAVELYLENAKELDLLDELPSLSETEKFTTQFEVALR